MKKSIILLTGIGLFLSGVVFLQTAHAMTLVPPSLEFTAKPGETIDGRVKLINEESGDKTLYVSTANFTAKGETGEPNFLFDAPTADLALWIQPSVDTVQLTSKQAVEVPFSIVVPANAEPGGHYSGIFFANQPNTEAGSGQIGIGSKIGTLIIVRVDGNVTEQASIKQFGRDNATSALNRLPQTLFVRVENTGNVHVRPSGTVTVKNMFGKQVASLAVNPNTGAVLPKSVRRFDVVWQRHMADAKHGSFFQELGSEWGDFAFGKYTATVSLLYGQPEKTMTATTTFSVYPWRLLVVIFLALILAVLLIVLLVHSYNKKLEQHIEQRLRAESPTGPGKNNQRK